METASPVTAHLASTLRPSRPVHRVLPLELFELEPESGEDECLPIDLGLDQIED